MCVKPGGGYFRPIGGWCELSPLVAMYAEPTGGFMASPLVACAMPAGGVMASPLVAVCMPSPLVALWQAQWWLCVCRAHWWLMASPLVAVCAMPAGGIMASPLVALWQAHWWLCVCAKPTGGYMASPFVAVCMACWGHVLQELFTGSTWRLEPLVVGRLLLCFSLHSFSPYVDVLLVGPWETIQELRDPELRRLASLLPDTVLGSRADSTATKYMYALQR